MLKRTGFKRKQVERRVTLHQPIAPENRRGSIAPVVRNRTSAIEKENALQHAGYMDIVRAMSCAHCGCAPRSQFCHTDETKGMGIKTDCRKGWPGCDSCHYLIGTKRIYPRDERRALEAKLAAQTRTLILAAGLWPKNLPLWVEA